jgi:outer membrane protein insertion porin family/translocation and assembly module TamA
MRFSAVCLLALAVFAAGCKEEGTIAVHSLTFKGNHAVDDATLRNALATKAGSKLPFAKKKYFDRQRLEADLKRVKALYADHGYPDARVTDVKVVPNKAQTAVDITLSVEEGQPIVVQAVHFNGFDVVPESELADIRDHMPLDVGKPRVRQAVVTTHETALNALRDHGYPYATVKTAEDDGTDGHQATLTFTADPGPLAHFGPIEVAGNQSVGDNVIRRELTFKPGDLYRRSKVQESQRRLYGMDLFQFVNVQVLDRQAKNPEVKTRVTVAENKHQRVNFGVGYGTEEKARVDAEYHDLNFLGGARSAGVHGRWSSLDRGLRLTFNQPYIFHPHFSLAGEGQQWYTSTPAYRSVVTGAKATLTHRSGIHNSWGVSFNTEYDSSRISSDVLNDLTLRNDLIALGLDPTTGRQEGQLNALAFDLQRITADNLLNAQKGYQLAFHAEEAGTVLGGTFKYVSVSVDGRHYWPIGQSLVWANRLQLGTIDPRNGVDANVPFSKKYFLGGATSVRGWGRYEVSPLSGSGLPIGGDSLAAATSELRFSLTGKLGAVAFLDAGNVWADPWAIRVNDLRYAIGPGLRYQTPIGPVRLDFGYQLNPIPGLLVNGEPQSRRWRIHFSIGQAF